MNDNQIKHMVERFLQWRLPENFNPDGGISFKKTFNEHTPHPMKHEPVGTNLFDFSQAEEMVRYMIEGMPEALAESAEKQVEGLRAALQQIQALSTDQSHYLITDPSAVLESVQSVAEAALATQLPTKH